MNFANLTVHELSERLAAPVPTPGGGSAAAVSASLAAALVAMIARITVERRGGEDSERARLMAEISEEADLRRTELLELADRDAEAYDHVIAAHRRPKGTEGERERREEAIQQALREATEVPYAIAQACESVLELAQRAVQRGLRSALSDAATAACLAEAALQSALLVIDINLKSVRDEKYRHVYHKKRVNLAKQARARKEAVLAVAEDWIRPE